MQKRFSVLAVAIATALSTPVMAFDFSYSGFSTAAYSQSDTDEAKVGYVGQPGGIDSDGDATVDSKLGVQLTAKFNDVLSATVQGVAYADLTGDWEPHLDWAYVRWQAAPSLSARVGYLRAPTFMYSDSIFVGYANSWLRAPMEVYNLSPAYQLRGVDLTWRETVGAYTVSLQPYYGSSSLDIGKPAQELKFKDWTGLVASIERGPVQARVGYSTVTFDTQPTSLGPLVSAIASIPAAFCARCSEVAAGLNLKGNKVKILDAGVQYDQGDNLAMVEYARQRDSAEFISSEAHSAYATYGRRFGGLMPYATYAIYRIDSPTSTNAIPAVGALAPLAAAVNGIMAGDSDQDTYSIGVRYELPAFSVVKGALLKVQYDHIDTDGGPGMLNDVQPGFDGTVNLFGLSLDFVF